jgi:DNA-directed RNA polymerase specialized sigma24 family protein
MVKIAQFPEAVTASSNAHPAQSSRTVRARKRPSVKHAAAVADASATATAIDAKDEVLSRVLDLLSHHQRMALRLRHRDGLAPNAVAARMHLPETIVRDLIDTAERTIRAAQRLFIEAMVEAANAGASSRSAPFA